MSDLLAAAGGRGAAAGAAVGGYFGTWVDALERAISAAAGARGPALGGLLAGLGRADRAGRVSVRAARERAGDRLPGRASRPASAGRACTACARSPTRSCALAAGHARRAASASACCAGRARSAGAAPVTTPTARCGSWRARCACSPTSRVAPARPLPALPAGLPLGGSAARGGGRRRDGLGPRRSMGAAARQPDRLRGPRPVRGAAARADPARRLGLSDPRRVEVPPELLGLARRAADACPTLALLLDEGVRP